MSIIMNAIIGIAGITFIKYYSTNISTGIV